MAERLLRIKQVIPMVNLSASTIWRFYKQGKFPEPVRLTNRVTVWRQSDIQAFIDNKQADIDKKISKKRGRKKKDVTRSIKLEVMLTEEENNKIEALAEKLKMNKARLVRNIVLGEIEDGILVNIGVLPIMQKVKAYYLENFKNVNYWEEIKKED